ncbi:hypothetical protein [Sphingomonas aerolata]|uniref:hypothetical protein n=1 Tax=Sphingomonas aerolata TaxID=185951 RepID=UPI000D3BA7A8|nr:hypothetical protein [Sphingomonas aerolata]
MVTPPQLPPAKSQAEFLSLARQKLALVKLLLHTKGQRTACYVECGFAVEALLKALILQVHQKISWDATLDGYRHHELKGLAEGCGITTGTLIAAAEFRAAWATVFQWRRSAGYHPFETTFAIADGMYEASFGQKGVAKWIELNFQLAL